MAKSKIKWTTYSLNRWIGCTEISEACDNCYARELNARRDTSAWSKGPDGKGAWGAGVPRYATSAGTRNAPMKWNRKAAKQRAHAEAEGLDWHRPRVFCYSLADVLDTELPKDDLRELLAMALACPELDFLLLTKRHNQLHRIPTTLEELTGKRTAPNVWLGVTAENQKWWDIRVACLMATDAAVRWVSVEPMLGPVAMGALRPDVIVVGGESIMHAGQTARPQHPNWARCLRDECLMGARRVGFSFKQHGHYATRPQAPLAVDAWLKRHSEDEVTRLAVDLGHGVLAYPVGADAAGQLLDGGNYEEGPGGVPWEGGDHE